MVRYVLLILGVAAISLAGLADALGFSEGLHTMSVSLICLALIAIHALRRDSLRNSRNELAFGALLGLIVLMLAMAAFLAWLGGRA